MANIFRRQKVDVEALQKELQQKEEELSELRNVKKSILQEVNTIHLYAALSEEETQTESLKEKQRVIMDVCKKVIRELN